MGSSFREAKASLQMNPVARSNGVGKNLFKIRKKHYKKVLKSVLWRLVFIGWRYLQAAHRVILLDAGHGVCQNLYLAYEAIQAGTCAIAAYDQTAMDELIQVDGEEQFTIYLAPVGKY